MRQLKDLMAHIEFVQAVERAADLLAHRHYEAHVGEAALPTTEALHVRHSILLISASLDLSNGGLPKSKSAYSLGLHLSS